MLFIILLRSTWRRTWRGWTWGWRTWGRTLLKTWAYHSVSRNLPHLSLFRSLLLRLMRINFVQREFSSLFEGFITDVAFKGTIIRMGIHMLDKILFQSEAFPTPWMSANILHLFYMCCFIVAFKWIFGRKFVLTFFEITHENGFPLLILRFSNNFEQLWILSLSSGAR